jgi:hypothetical protein
MKHLYAALLSLSVAVQAVSAEPSTAPPGTTAAAPQTSATVADAGKPDSVAILKRYGDLLDISKRTGLNGGGIQYRVMLCRDAILNCDMYQAGQDKLTELADYAYLYTVYARYFKKSTPVISSLREEAKQKEYGEQLLKAYSEKYKCVHSKEPARCTFERMSKAIPIQRFLVERDPKGLVLLDVVFNYTEEDGIRSLDEAN